MNIKLNFLIAGLLLFTLVFSGCVSNTIEGTYINNAPKAHPGGFTEPVNDSLQVFPDNTFFLKDLDTGESYSGIVKQQGEEYIFTGSLISFSGKMIDGNFSIEGKTYVKQR